jgi:nitronate monooxygenase
MIVTALTEMFGLQHPIVLGPMGGVSGGRLAATVSNAGGLGLVGGGYGDPAWLRTELPRVKKETQQPWGVGLITWSVDRSVVELVLAYQPHAVMLSFGDPRPYVSAIKSAGSKLICQVQDPAETRIAQEAGPTSSWPRAPKPKAWGSPRPVAVGASGSGCGRTNTGVAAGGIADGRGVAAALMLGADGALIGTRF